MSKIGELFRKTWDVKFPYVDLRLAAVYGCAAGLGIAKLWEPMLALDWYWYFIIAALAGIKPLVTFWRSF